MLTQVCYPDIITFDDVKFIGLKWLSLDLPITLENTMADTEVINHQFPLSTKVCLDR